MKKTIIVAKSLFTRRIKRPNYYWMIFAPILLVLIGLGCNHFIEQSNQNEHPRIAVVAPQQVKTEIIQQEKNTKNHLRFSQTNFKSLKQAKSRLNNGNLDGIIYIKNNQLTAARYIYKKQAAASENVTKDLNQILSSVKIQTLAAAMGLSLKQVEEITSPVKISLSSINPKQDQSDHREKMQTISQFVVIGGFLLLTSYISITGAEIGREKSDHLIEGVLASISTRNYFAGKMLGVLFLLGFQIVIYAGIAILVNSLLPFFHQKALFNLSFFKGVSIEYIILTSLLMIVAIILYILLAAIIASFVSRTEDISQATSVVASLILIPYLIGLIASSNSDLGFIKILSYIPFESQSIMPVRIATETASYSQGWIALIISILAMIPLFDIASAVYQKHIFKYSHHNLFYNLIH